MDNLGQWIRDLMVWLPQTQLAHCPVQRILLLVVLLRVIWVDNLVQWPMELAAPQWAM